jgi:hypothetical protein
VASRQIRTLILCLFAVFAFSAVAASTASAHHVWTVGCIEKAGEGKEPPKKFDTKECTTHSKPLPERKFEKVPIPIGTADKTEVVKVVKNFQLKAGTTTITCEAVTLKEGTIENIEPETGKKTGRDKGTVEFSKCKSSVAGCTVSEPIKDKGKVSALVEGSVTKNIYDMFTAEGWKEEATKAGANAQIGRFAKITQTPAPPCINTEVEGNGVAAEIVPEEPSVTKILKFPCPKLSPVNQWNGVTEVTLTLEAFTLPAEECGEVELELVSKAAWSVE